GQLCVSGRPPNGDLGMLFQARVGEVRGLKFTALRYKFALVLFAFFMFEIGLAARKYDPFPYPQLRSWKNKIARSDSVEVLSRQYSNDPKKVAMDRNIES